MVVMNTRDINHSTQSLRYAIDRQEFEVVYQPKFVMQTEQIVGCEALLRWTQEDGCVISPDIFIPQAEESGMITSITLYVVEQVFRCLREWNTKRIKIVPVSINVSRIDLCAPAFIEQFIELFEEYQIDSQDIELEITETAMGKECNKIADKISILRSRGIRIAIDDFGTGYSSLLCLKTLPIDIIKIDRMFLKDIVTDAVDQSILKCILVLAEIFHLEVVYEGVETVEQISYLKQFGFMKAQGFYFARAMHEQELEIWLIDKTDFFSNAVTAARQDGYPSLLN